VIRGTTARRRRSSGTSPPICRFTPFGVQQNRPFSCDFTNRRYKKDAQFRTLYPQSYQDCQLSNKIT
jgi:hypothetical protein